MGWEWDAAAWPPWLPLGWGAGTILREGLNHLRGVIEEQAWHGSGVWLGFLPGCSSSGVLGALSLTGMKGHTSLKQGTAAPRCQGHRDTQHLMASHYKSHKNESFRGIHGGSWAGMGWNGFIGKAVCCRIARRRSDRTGGTHPCRADGGGSEVAAGGRDGVTVGQHGVGVGAGRRGLPGLHGLDLPLQHQVVEAVQVLRGDHPPHLGEQRELAGHTQAQTGWSTVTFLGRWRAPSPP